VLPSFNLAFDVNDEVVARLGAARTLTRPTVTAMIPNTSVNSSFVISTGNPELAPYLSNQVDVGVEWYFNDESVIALSYFDKVLTGFIQNETTPGVFGDAGLPLDILDPQIFAGVTMDTPFDFNRPMNVPDETTIEGWELLYQQPLSFIAEGLGTMVNFSKVNGSTTFIAGNGEVVPSNIVGLSDYSYNIVLYYETETFSIRGSYNYRDDYTATNCCVNGQPLLITREGSGQFDMSATYVLPFAENVTLTLEGINLNENDEYTYFGDSDMLQRYIGSGRQVFLGARATF
jgi:iron complex outermembrane recepter protein